MVRLIMGVKGSGKTKQLIELINNAAKDEPGNVVCIEANRTMTYDIHYHSRLIDAQEYKLDSYELFRGFISGLYAGNYDISHVFIDNLCKTIGREVDKLSLIHIWTRSGWCWMTGNSRCCWSPAPRQPRTCRI